MTKGARRLAMRPLHAAARRVLAALCLLLAFPLAAAAQEITDADYSMPTDRYPHGVLGDDEEWARLTVEVTRRKGEAGDLFSGQLKFSYNFDMPEEFVFEDTAPRLWDVTGDGLPEVVVVQSHAEFGARLVVIGIVDGRPGLLAATPFIGQRNRWLAPVAAADIDGDGQIEIAYVDRPHLAKTLRVWRLTGETLTEVAQISGVSNHRIGERDIAGGLRTCAGTPELIVASGDWRRLRSVTFDGKRIVSRDIGPHVNRDSFAAALSCS